MNHEISTTVAGFAMACAGPMGAQTTSTSAMTVGRLPPAGPRR